MFSVQPAVPPKTHLLYLVRRIGVKENPLIYDCKLRQIESCMKQNYRKDSRLSTPPTTPHCGHFATVTVTVSNLCPKTNIQSVGFMSKPREGLNVPAPLIIFLYSPVSL